MGAAQTEPLDPARNLPLHDRATLSPLPEQYIWTAGDVTVQRPDRSHYPWNRTDLRTGVHRFRVHFQVGNLPHSGTLYLAGPRWAKAWLNGVPLGEFSTGTDQPINFRVFHADVTRALRPGDNVLAVEAIRGRGVASATRSLATQQLAYGEVLAAKVTAGAFGDGHAADLVISDHRLAVAGRRRPGKLAGDHL